MGKCHCIEYVPCANRLMKTGRPGCRTKVNDVINTAVSKRASLADVISFYFFFSPPFPLSLSPSPSFFSFLYSAEQIRSRARKYCASCRCEKGGEGKGRDRGGHECKLAEKEILSSFDLFGEKGGPLYLSPFSLSFAIECWKIGRNRVKIGWTHYSTIWGCACLEYDTDLMESRVLWWPILEITQIFSDDFDGKI